MASTAATRRKQKQEQESAGRPEFGVIGSTGLKHQGGRLQEEFHPELRYGQRAIKVYTEMSWNDGAVGALLFAFKNLIRQTDFFSAPSGDTPAHQEQADFLGEALDDMSISWSDLISEILSMLPYGWSYFESVYKLRAGKSEDPSRRSKFDDNKVGWRKHSIRAQDALDRWEFDEGGGVKGAWFYPTAYGGSPVFIPIEKSLLFRTESRRGSPEGVSLLRTAYRSWHFKKRLEEIEAIGAKKDFVGMAEFSVPERVYMSDAPKDQAVIEALKVIGQQMQRDEFDCIIHPADTDEEGKPTGWGFKLVQSGGSRQFDLHQSIIRYRAEMLMSVLAQFLALGTEKVGSFSLASTQTALFSYAIGAILDAITDVFNRFAIPRLFTLNGVDPELWPTLEHGDIERPELPELAQYISTLVTAGVLTPDDKLEGFAREHGTLPPQETNPEPRPAEKRRRRRRLGAQLHLFRGGRE
jgi:hypothetical protein